MGKPLAILIVLFLSLTNINAQSPCDLGTVYKNCKACGTAKGNKAQTLNVQKNRDDEATDTKPLSVEDIRKPSNNKRFKPNMQVQITGYVASVVHGGFEESCNCGRKDLQDIHINIVANPKEVGNEREYVVVEFTPRWQEKFGLDNSNYPKMVAAVEKKLKGKWVHFEGWMLYDYIHADKSESTNPGGDGNWRATPWEVHPVTSYRVVPKPVE